MDFTGIANATSTPIGWKGGWWVGSQEVVGKGYVLTKNNQMATIGAIFTPTYHTKQLNPCPNLSANHMVNYSRLYACQGRWSHLKTTLALMDILQASETQAKPQKHKPQQSSLGNIQH